MLRSKGFTLIELLVIIAIIVLLASVSLVSLQSARNRANRNSALQSARSVLPHLKACADDRGYGITTVAPTASVYTCCNSASTTTDNCDSAAKSVVGYPKWPDVTTKLAWQYCPPIGTLAGGDYAYTLQKSADTCGGAESEKKISCSISTNNCN